MPYIGKTTDGFGVRNRFVYLASSGATSVSGADANGATLTFTDGAYVDVYLNGVLLKPTTDYNTSTANTIAGLSALNTNDEVTVVVYDVFTVADMVSATSGGTFSGNVTFNGTVTNSSTTTLNDDVTFTGANYNVMWDKSANDLSFDDNAKLTFGASNDLSVYHDGSNTYIDESGTGALFIRSSRVSIHKYTGETMINAAEDSAVSLYYDDSKKLETVSGGVEIYNGSSGSTPSLTLKDMNSGVVSGDIGGGLYFYTNDGNGQGNNCAVRTKYENSAGGAGLAFETGTGSSRSERVRIDASGNVIANANTSTDTVIYDNSSGSHGPILHAEFRVDIARSATMMSLNSTTSSSSSYVDLRRAGTSIGSISHNSASTVSYNAFTGSHWGRLSDNSKPTILKGTVLETIDEMCDWYEVEFTIPEVKYVDGDAIPKDKKVGDVKTEAQGKKYLVPLEDIKDKKVGEAFTFTYKDGVEYTGTLKLEDEEKHAKCKVSDVADSKKVYGVFFSWDGEDDGYNDMYVAGLGTYVVRVHKDVTVESGDLLVSNGDGTAKVQDDDIIRTKTIGKVLTNVKQETYSDGSYTVPCALYCG